MPSNPFETDKESFERTMELEKKKYKQWYHTIDFGNGDITDGIYDHRPILNYYGFPENLKGKRVLDVGCADGFFSFEFEKLGGEVVALDAYKNDLFLEAKKKLNSKVEYIIMDAMDISPEKLGYFDFVFCGTVLIHLINPIGALKNIRNIIKEGGVFISANLVWKRPWLSLVNSLFYLLKRKLVVGVLVAGRPKTGEVPSYWYPTEDCLREMIYKAGFDKIEKVSNFTLKGYSKAIKRKETYPHVVFRMRVE